ncbi:MAG: PQQ-binding-like beta-propeller repeat protein [Planctomycetes bacterium]|nr:PQQ-binding-like beta-propeller repeat protein [Planctomycetota bacterium]
MTDISSYDENHLNLIWTYQVEGRATQGAVVSDDILWYVMGKFFYGLSVSSGQLLCEIDLGETPLQAPVIHEGIAIFPMEKCVLGVSLKDGSKKMQLNINIAQMRGIDSLIKNGPLVIVNARNRRLYAINPKKGRIAWESATASNGYTACSFSKDTLYVGDLDGGVHAIRLSDGKTMWTYKAGGAVYGPSQPVNNVVVAGSFDSYLYAFRASTGNLLWKTNLGSRIEGKACIVGKRVICGCFNKKIAFMDLPQGSILGEIPTRGVVYEEPQVTGPLHVCVDHNGDWYCFDEFGDWLWRYPAPLPLKDKIISENNIWTVYSDRSGGLLQVLPVHCDPDKADVAVGNFETDLRLHSLRCQQEGKDFESLRHINHAIKKSPAGSLAHLERAQVMGDLGWYDEQVDDLQFVVNNNKVASKKSEAQGLLVNALNQQGQREKAEKLLSAMTEDSEPEHIVRLNVSLAVNDLLEGEVERALSRWRNISSDSLDHDLSAQWWRALSDVGLVKEALLLTHCMAQSFLSEDLSMEKDVYDWERAACLFCADKKLEDVRRLLRWQKIQPLSAIGEFISIFACDDLKGQHEALLRLKEATPNILARWLFVIALGWLSPNKRALILKKELPRLFKEVEMCWEQVWSILQPVFHQYFDASYINDLKILILTDLIETRKYDCVYRWMIREQGPKPELDHNLWVEMLLKMGRYFYENHIYSKAEKSVSGADQLLHEGDAPEIPLLNNCMILKGEILVHLHNFDGARALWHKLDEEKHHDELIYLEAWSFIEEFDALEFQKNVSLLEHSQEKLESLDSNDFAAKKLHLEGELARRFLDCGIEAKNLRTNFQSLYKGLEGHAQQKLQEWTGEELGPVLEELSEVVYGLEAELPRHRIEIFHQLYAHLKS